MQPPTEEQLLANCKRTSQAMQELFLNQRNKQRASRYGLTLQQAEQLGAVQECQICGKSNEQVSCLCVDHDHETGHVRGILCNDCNISVGHIERFKRMGKLQEALQWTERGLDH